MVVLLPTPNKHYLLWEKLLIWSQISSEGHLLTYTERNLLLPTDGLQQNGPFGQIFANGGFIVLIFKLKMNSNIMSENSKGRFNENGVLVCKGIPSILSL